MDKSAQSLQANTLCDTLDRVQGARYASEERIVRHIFFPVMHLALEFLNFKRTFFNEGIEKIRKYFSITLTAVTEDDVVRYEALRIGVLACCEGHLSPCALLLSNANLLLLGSYALLLSNANLLLLSSYALRLRNANPLLLSPCALLLSNAKLLLLGSYTLLLRNANLLLLGKHSFRVSQSVRIRRTQRNLI